MPESNDPCATAARLDVGGPGVAGGSTDDGPTTAAPCRWCGAKDGEPHDGATHDAYAASDPPGVGYNAPTPSAITVIREALAAPHLQDDPASARLTPQERLENRASVVYWALFDAGLLTEANI